MTLTKLQTDAEFLRAHDAPHVAVVLTIEGPELRCDGCAKVQPLKKAELFDGLIPRLKAYGEAHSDCAPTH